MPESSGAAPRLLPAISLLVARKLFRPSRILPLIHLLALVLVPARLLACVLSSVLKR